MQDVGRVLNFLECVPHHVFPPYIKSFKVCCDQGVFVAQMRKNDAEDPFLHPLNFTRLSGCQTRMPDNSRVLENIPDYRTIDGYNVFTAESNTC